MWWFILHPRWSRIFVRLTCRIASPFVAIAGTRQFGQVRSVGNCLRPERFLPVNYLLLHKSLLPRAGLEFTHPESNCSSIHRSRTARAMYTERPIRKPISIRRETKSHPRPEHTLGNYGDYLGVCTVHQKKKEEKRKKQNGPQPATTAAMPIGAAASLTLDISTFV